MNDIGIIGSADGPTMILVTSNPTDWVIIAVLVALIALLIVWFVIKKRKRK